MSRVYLDHAASTAMEPAVCELMDHLNRDLCGNPSSAHLFGQRCRSVLDTACDEIAEMIGAASGDEILITSGGTEANNLVLQGAFLGTPSSASLAISGAEHASVFETATHMQSEGRRLTILGCDGLGRMRAETFRQYLQNHAAPHLLSLIWANNELGSINEIEEILFLCREHGILLHSDAVQALGKLPLTVKDCPLDFLSASAHKFYGPCGVGFLYHRSSLALAPLFYGGKQQAALRAGSVNPIGAAAMALALRLCLKRQDEQKQKLELLAELCLEGIVDLPGLVVNGDRGIPGLLSLTFEDVPSELLLLSLDLDGIAISAGSACHTGSTAPNRVLLAAGLSEANSRSTIRVSPGAHTTDKDMLFFTKQLRKHVLRLRGDQ
jgi:cysteine desulfurase